MLTLPVAVLLALAESVSLQTPAGPVHGTLLVPDGPAPVPVVLIVAGSGPTDRNGNSSLLSGPNDSLKMLAEALAERGFASLRYDKRGVGASVAAAPAEMDLRFDMYVDDAAGWLAMLRDDPRFSRVYVAGHSEGSLIGILAAQRVPVDGVISIAGAGRPAGDVLLEQMADIPPALLEEARRIVAELNAGRLVDRIPPEFFGVFRRSVQPYLISWFRYDPAAEAAKLTVPLLVVQGTTDLQVSLDDAYLLAAAAQPPARLLIVHGMNHVLKDVPLDTDAQIRSYSDPTLPLSPPLAVGIRSFLEPSRRIRAVAR